MLCDLGFRVSLSNRVSAFRGACLTATLELFLAACCLLPATCCLLPTACCCLLPAAYCRLLPAAWCLLPVTACCLLLPTIPHLIVGDPFCLTKWPAGGFEAIAYFTHVVRLREKIMQRPKAWLPSEVRLPSKGRACLNYLVF